VFIYRENVVINEMEKLSALISNFEGSIYISWNYLTKWLKLLADNVDVGTALGSIPASTDKEWNLRGGDEAVLKKRKNPSLSVCGHSVPVLHSAQYF